VAETSHDVENTSVLSAIRGILERYPEVDDMVTAKAMRNLLQDEKLGHGVRSEAAFALGKMMAIALHEFVEIELESATHAENAFVAFNAAIALYWRDSEAHFPTIQKVGNRFPAEFEGWKHLLNKEHR
jgi:HEAT repeat protein